MRYSRKTLTAIASAVVLAAAAVIMVLAVSGRHAPATHPAARRVAVAAIAACAKLSAAVFPPAVYDELIIREANRGASPRTAKATVAAEIKAACPQFSYLAHA